MQLKDLVNNPILEALTKVEGFSLQIHKDFKPLFVTDEHGEIFGYSSKQEFLRSGSILDQIPDDLKALAKERYKVVIEQGWTPEHTVKSRRVDGSFVWLRIQDRRIKIGDDYCVMSIMVNIDKEIKAVNDADRAAESERQARVVLQRIQSIAIENEKKSALNQLMSGVSQQLKQPASQIESAVSATAKMMDDARNQLFDDELTQSKLLAVLSKAQENIDEIRNSTERVFELIKSINTIAADADEVASSAFRPAPLIADTFDIMMKETCTVNILYEHDLDEKLTIISNPNIWRQLISILFENAIDHGFKGQASGSLKLQLFTRDDEVIFRFSDNGVGIPLRKRPRVFDAFYSTGEPDSTGLGLTLAHKLVTRDLAGEITLVDSEFDSGTTFEVRLYGAIAP